MVFYNFMDLVHFYLKWFTLELIVISRHTFILFSWITSNVWTIVFFFVSSPGAVSSPRWQDPHTSFSGRESSGTIICPQLALSRWHAHSAFCCEVAGRKWWKDSSFEAGRCACAVVYFGWRLCRFRSRVVYLFQDLRYVKGETAKYAFACSIDLVDTFQCLHSEFRHYKQTILLS